MSHTQEHHDEHKLPFWLSVHFSTDHKIIGIQYGITALIFLLLGFSMMLMMRWQLAYPDHALPLIGQWFGESRMPVE